MTTGPARFGGPGRSADSADLAPRPAYAPMPMHVLRMADESELRHRVKTALLATAEATNGERTGSMKDGVRAAYADRRLGVKAAERRFIDRVLPLLRHEFAEGREVDPHRVTPRLHEVRSGTREADLFRLSCLLWSVPVSRGFGRRIRFVVKDEYNGKLIGLIALGDPVFNLRVRDRWIGWSSKDRQERLCNVMDAYVLGAVPPYNRLIGGKLVAALIASQEVRNAFRRKYGSTTGIIDGRVKNAKLVLATTTSALGRSSIYNRLKIGDHLMFQPLGYTAGWGHFHVPEAVFRDMHALLRSYDHQYATGYKFGNGPNWRMRVIREALRVLDLPQDALLHGVQRQVFAVPLAKNCREILQGEHVRCRWRNWSVAQLSSFCRDRWVIPRATRDASYADVRREDTVDQLYRERP